MRVELALAARILGPAADVLEALISVLGVPLGGWFIVQRARREQTVALPVREAFFRGKLGQRRDGT